MSPADINQILFERSGEAVLLLNRQGQVVKLNREACKLLSTDPDRASGRPVLATVIPRDRDRVKELFLRVLGGQEREWIARVRRGDGVTRVLRMRAVPVQHGGVAEAIVMFARDLTESRAGRPETIQLQTLLENLPGQLVAVLDLEGHVRYSSGLSRTHFRDDLEVLGKPYEILLEPGEENERLLSQMLHEVSDGRDWGGTLWHRRVDGAVVPLRTYASPYLDPRNGRILGALVASRDVSVEYDWRERAHRAQRLAGIGSLVGGVAARVADAVSRVEVALGHGVPGEDYAEGYSVPAELARTHALMASLRDLAAQTKLERARFALPSEVGPVVEELAPRFREAGVSLRMEPTEELGTVLVDPDQVRHVARLVLSNALESGASEVVVSFTSSSEGTELHVLDNGPGVDAESLHRVFEPFFSTKRGHAGLGLSMARASVRAQGGEMRAEAGPRGRGFSVVARFPMEVPGSTQRFRPTSLNLGRARSVLVVDDEDAVRSSIRRFLQKVGFEVREAWSGRSALAQITVGRPPELVLTDLKMTDGSGTWFMEQLAQDFPDILRRTVIVTGEMERMEAARITRETGCPVILKPLEMSQLLDVLDEVAARA